MTKTTKKKTVKKRAPSKKKPTVRKKRVTTKIEYNSSLKTAGLWCHAKGKTVEEAITNLKPKVNKVVGVLIIERITTIGRKKESVKKEKILQRNILYRLFAEVSPTMKSVGIKQAVQLFDL